MNDDLIKKLCNLAQLDIDAVNAYNQALEQIKENDIYNHIASFRDDHIRHIDELSEEILKNNGEPPKQTKDFKGYLIEGFTSLRSITGTGGALKAMETNEILTNKTYKKALEDDGLTIEARKLIERNYSDEQRHLEYIRSILSDKDNFL